MKVQKNLDISKFFLNSMKGKNAKNQSRTGDTRIFNPLLYQLSYLGVFYYFLLFITITNYTRKTIHLSTIKLLESVQFFLRISG